MFVYLCQNKKLRLCPFTSVLTWSNTSRIVRSLIQLVEQGLLHSFFSAQLSKFLAVIFYSKRLVFHG